MDLIKSSSPIDATATMTSCALDEALTSWQNEIPQGGNWLSCGSLPV